MSSNGRGFQAFSEAEEAVVSWEEGDRVLMETGRLRTRIGVGQ